MKCKYFPCHKDMDDCRFCYCPLYPCLKNKRGGKFIQDKQGNNIWDCSDCNIIHQKKIAERLESFLSRKKYKK